MFRTRSEGGCYMRFSLRLPQPHSSICLIPLWLAALKRPSASDAGERLGRERPPKKQGGHAAFRSGRVLHTSTRPHDGSLTSSFIPAGRLRTDPLSPRASSWRIGPRRQGFASPLRALDCSGPIRKTRCLRGERGGSAERGIERLSFIAAKPKGNLSAIPDA